MLLLRIKSHDLGFLGIDLCMLYRPLLPEQWFCSCSWLETQVLYGGGIFPLYGYYFHFRIWATLSNTEEDGKVVPQCFWKDPLIPDLQLQILPAFWNYLCIFPQYWWWGLASCKTPPNCSSCPQLKGYILEKAKTRHHITNLMKLNCRNLSVVYHFSCT